MAVWVANVVLPLIEAVSILPPEVSCPPFILLTELMVMSPSETALPNVNPLPAVIASVPVTLESLALIWPPASIMALDPAPVVVRSSVKTLVPASMSITDPAPVVVRLSDLTNPATELSVIFPAEVASAVKSISPAEEDMLAAPPELIPLIVAVPVAATVTAPLVVVIRSES